MVEYDSGNTVPHRSVLYQQIINALGPQSPGRYVDATVGAGGHAWGILNACAPKGRLLGLDLDPQALNIAQQRLADFSDRAILIQASYTTLSEQLERLGWENIQGMVIDLGVSSMQLDQPERGFSFQAEGPLDMRFDPGQPISAETVVNEWSEHDLADLIWRYGEEQQSRRIAKAIVRDRPFHTTQALAEAVSRAVGGRKGAHVHPATRTFQALRIVVNGELQAIEDVLPQAVTALAPGARLAVISFHSLEDRIVKHFIQQHERGEQLPFKLPVKHSRVQPKFKRLGSAIKPSEMEILSNPRARSAVLRIGEKQL